MNAAARPSSGTRRGGQRAAGVAQGEGESADGKRVRREAGLQVEEAVGDVHDRLTTCA